MFHKNIFNLIGSKKKHLILIILLMITTLLLSVIFTFLLSYSINYVSFNIVSSKVNDLSLARITNSFNDYLHLFKESNIYLKFLPLIAIFVAILSLKYVISIFITKLKNIISTYIKVSLRQNLYQKITKQGISLLDNISIASLEQSAIEGLEQLDLYFTVFLPQFFYALLAPLILFAATVIINYKVALVLLGCVPLIPLTIMLFARKAKHTVNKYLDKYHHLGDTFLDGTYGINELKLNLSDQIYFNKLEGSSQDFRKTTMKVLSIQLISLSLMDLIAFGAAGAGIILSLITKNTNSFFNATYFILFLILISAEFFIPLRQLGSAFHISLNGVSASKKITNILSLEELNWGLIKESNYNYTLKNVSFKYSKNIVLNNIDLEIKNKQITAIAGTSGSGKSTLIKLLLGQIQPQTGDIFVNNIKLFDLDKTTYYQDICLVSSDSYLFNDTIRNNFLLYNKDLSDEEIINSLKQVGLDNLVSQKRGLDYLINDVRSNLSGGERQRIYLAIMLLLNKKIYIFDEATSNIDKDSEKIILDLIYQLRKDKTIIIISHWLSNLAKSDIIYYLKNTNLVECGKHQDLITSKKGYYQLYKLQQELVKGLGEHHEN